MISNPCAPLATIGFYNCEFKDRGVVVIEEDLLYFPRQEMEEMEPMLELKVCQTTIII